MEIQFKNRIQTMIITALFAALIVVLTMIQFPLPTGIPVTLQTFGVALCGFMLGAKKGTIAVVVYIMLGIVGLPVFTAFGSGIGKILGPTGGFIYAFPLMTIICGLALKLKQKWLSIVVGTLSILVLHFFGMLHLSIVSNISLLEAFLAATAPFLIKDAVSVVAAYFVALVVNKQLVRSRLVMEKQKG